MWHDTHAAVAVEQTDPLRSRIVTWPHGACVADLVPPPGAGLSPAAVTPDAIEALGVPYAYAHWDGRERALTLGRAREGSRRLHVYATEDLVVFGTSLRALLATGCVPRRADLARVTTSLLPALEWAAARRTLVHGVIRLAPGSRRLVTPSRDVETPWRPPEQPAVVREPRVALDAFKAGLQAAALRRLGSDARIAVLLSGGLDSGIMLGMLREHRAQGRISAPLRTYSAVGSAARWCADRPHVEAAVRGGALDGAHILDPSAGADPEAHLEALLDRAEDAFALTQLGLRSIVATFARGQGERVLVTGVEGDYVFDANPAFLAQQLTDGRWGGWIERLSRRASDHRRDRFETIWHDAIRPLLGRAVARRGRRPGGWVRYAEGIVAESGLDAGLVRELGLMDPLVESLREPVFDDRGAWLGQHARMRNRLASSILTSAAERYAGLGDAVGLRLEHPLMDAHVARSALAIPAEALVRSGRTKHLIRTVAEGYVPERTRARHRGPNPWWPVYDKETPRPWVLRRAAAAKDRLAARFDALASSIPRVSPWHAMLLDGVLDSLALDGAPMASP